jgi:hypothetical protein
VKQEFISINRTIQDYDEYVKNIILLKNYLKNKVKELLLDENFVLTNSRNDSYHSLTLTFFNTEKDLEIELIVRKKNCELFV